MKLGLLHTVNNRHQAVAVGCVGDCLVQRGQAVAAKHQVRDLDRGAGAWSSASAGRVRGASHGLPPGAYQETLTARVVSCVVSGAGHTAQHSSCSREKWKREGAKVEQRCCNGAEKAGRLASLESDGEETVTGDGWWVIDSVGGDGEECVADSEREGCVSVHLSAPRRPRPRRTSGRPVPHSQRRCDGQEEVKQTAGRCVSVLITAMSASRSVNTCVHEGYVHVGRSVGGRDKRGQRAGRLGASAVMSR